MKHGAKGVLLYSLTIKSIWSYLLGYVELEWTLCGFVSVGGGVKGKELTLNNEKYKLILSNNYSVLKWAQQSVLFLNLKCTYRFLKTIDWILLLLFYVLLNSVIRIALALVSCYTVYQYLASNPIIVCFFGTQSNTSYYYISLGPNSGQHSTPT